MGKSNVGTTISITPEIPDSESVGDYEALSFTKIGGVVSVGEYGDSCEAVQFSDLETGRKITVKGKASGGLFDVAYIPDDEDSGQSIVESANLLDSNYSFKVSRPDGLDEYFQGRVMTNKYATAESSSVLQKIFSVEVNTEVPGVLVVSGWNLQTASAEFPGRQRAQSIYYDNAWYIIGGFYSTPSVYKSNNDGLTWTNTGNLSGSRYWAGCIEFDGKVYIIGGRPSPGSGSYSSVTYSSDMASWTTSGTNGFVENSKFGCVVFNNKIWAIGGVTTSYKKTVYSSSNGIDWTLETSTPGFDERSSPCAVMNGKIWMVGGYRASTSNETSQIWSSTDGVSWVYEGVTGFGAIDNHQLIYAGGKLWCIGGNNSSGAYLNTVYSSKNGTTWTLENTADWSDRNNLCAISDNLKIMVMSGQSSDDAYHNDVWLSYR